jgi:hypothetical protein
MKGFELLWIREEYEEPVTLYLVSSRKSFNYPDKKEMP